MFGSGGESALADAFTHEFRFSIHLYSLFIYAVRKRELQDHKFPENKVSEILEMIFGELVGGHFPKDLLMQRASPSFTRNWKNSKDSKEQQNPELHPGFYEWLCQY